LAEVLLAWRRKSLFVADEDGGGYLQQWREKPYFYSGLLETLKAAGKKVGVDGIGLHFATRTEAGSMKPVPQLAFRRSS